MTNREALTGITGYPVPCNSINAIALRRGLGLDDTASPEEIKSRAFRLCEADMLMWLFRAPNVSQGGQSYNFTDEQRADFRRRATAIYNDCGDDLDRKANGVQYGYKGTRL